MSPTKNTDSDGKGKKLSSVQTLDDFCSDLRDSLSLENQELALKSMRDVEAELSNLDIGYMDASAAEQLGLRLCEDPELFLKAVSTSWAPLLRKPSAPNWGDYLVPCARSNYQGEGRLDAISYALDHARHEGPSPEARFAPFSHAAIAALSSKPLDEIKTTLLNWAHRAANEGLDEAFGRVGERYAEAAGEPMPAEVLRAARSGTPMGELTEFGRRKCLARAAELDMDLDQCWDNKWDKQTCVAKSTLIGLIECADDPNYRKRLSLRLFALAELGAQISPHIPPDHNSLPDEIGQAIALREAALIRREIGKDGAPKASKAKPRI